MTKRFLFIIIPVILLLIFTDTVFAQQPILPASASYILIDSKTGQVFAEQNPDTKLRPASTTKVMTAILALESGNLDRQVKISRSAVNDIGDGGMNIGIMADESNLTLENMLNVMLVKSANETANIIAENVSETRAQFIDKMNEKAVQLGALNTHFVNPCGKDDAKEDAFHLSTARDLAMIARYAMTIPKFREIVSKEYYNDLPPTNKHAKWDPLHTSNVLLWGNRDYPYTLDGVNYKYTVNGTKTGYTSAAGYNLISSAYNENGMELLAVILHVTEANNKVYTYSKDLLKYGFENFSNQRIATAGQIVKSVDVPGAKDGQKLDLVISSDLNCALPIDKNSWNIVTTENINLPESAPVSKGDILGNVTYTRNNVLLGKVDVIAANNVEKEVSLKLSDKIDTPIGRKADNVVGSTLYRLAATILALILVLYILSIFSKKSENGI